MEWKKEGRGRNGIKELYTGVNSAQRFTGGHGVVSWVTADAQRNVLAAHARPRHLKN